jgi:hypothetical protein
MHARTMSLREGYLRSTARLQLSGTRGQPKAGVRRRAKAKHGEGGNVCIKVVFTCEMYGVHLCYVWYLRAYSDRMCDRSMVTARGGEGGEGGEGGDSTSGCVMAYKM